MTRFVAVDDAPPSDPPTLRVTQARVPVLWWRDVAVTELEPVELNELDVFVVETAARLGQLDASAFDEFTGLPELVFAALGRRLQALELVEWRAGVLTPTGRATPALTEATAIRRTTTTVDLLYLPETDELLVAHGLADFERTGPPLAGMAAVPSELHGFTRRQLLSYKIEQRDVAGLPAAIVGLAGPDDDEPLTAMAGARPDPPVPVAPAVQATATVVLDGDHRRAILGVSSRQPDRKAKGRDGEKRQDELTTATLDVSGAAGLVDTWCAVADLLSAPEHRVAVVQALASVPLDTGALRPDGPYRWAVAVTASQARVLAEGALLTRPVGVEIREPQAWVRVAVRYTPADEEAERLFARDVLIQNLLAAPRAVAQTLEREAGTVERLGGPRVVRKRAWGLGHYWIVHALREQEDFAYA